MGTVAGAHLRGVCGQVQRVRRAGAPDWLYHRAGNGATDTGACWRADNCTGNRTRTLTTGGGKCTAADCSRSSRGNPEIEFDQTANLTAEGGDNQWTYPVDVDVDAEPVPELEFDQTVGW